MFSCSANLRGLLTGALGTLGIGFGVGAIKQEFQEIIEQAHQIHHEAERFGIDAAGIDAAQLQLIGNAAQSMGLTLEQTSKALNFLTINSQAGLNPDSKQFKAESTLGIDAQSFAAANATDKFLILSEAYRARCLDYLFERFCLEAQGQKLSVIFLFSAARVSARIASAFSLPSSALASAMRCFRVGLLA